MRSLHRGAKRTSYGRPRVEGIDTFGVSHSQSRTAYLLANRKYVGIDLEWRDRPDLGGLERRLDQVVKGADAIEVGFLTRWVLKEAGLKALGLPLVPTLRRVCLLAETPCEGDGLRAFEMAVGPIAMRAMTFDVGVCLIGLAYKANYGPPAMDVEITIPPNRPASPGGSRSCET